MGSKLDIRVNAEEFRKKLNIQDGKTPTQEELVSIIKPLIPKAVPGKDGTDYILTEKDKAEIASEIDVPIVEKVIERTEVIKEQPIYNTTEVIKEVVKEITPEEITKIAIEINPIIEYSKIKDAPQWPAGGLSRITKPEVQEMIDAIPPATSTFTDLTDTPSSYSSQGTKIVRVKADETGLEFVTPSSEADTLQTVTDRGAVTDNIITVPGVQFDTTATPATNAEGLLQWNDTDGTLDLGMSGGDVTMQIGQEMFTKVRNQSGSTILNGQAVYFSGRSGNRPLISLAQSDTVATSKVMGITTQDIDSPADGFITTVGYVRGIKTDYTGTGAWGTTWAEGDLLYVSKTVAGQLTNVEPAVPHHSDIVGTVGIIHSNLGSILISIDRHKGLEELSDVDGTPLATSGQFPVWNQTAGYFDFDKNINDYLPTATAATTYVPYTGATGDVDLGTHDLTTTGKITGELAKVQTTEPTTTTGNIWLDTDDDTVLPSNADTVDNFHASQTPTPDYILPLNSNGAIDVKDTYIENTTENEDILIKCNDGGVVRNAIQIHGTEGSVSFPRQSCVHARRTTNQTIATGTLTTIIFDSEQTDTLGEFDTTTGVFTAKTAGKYLVNVTTHWTNTDANKYYICYANANNTAIARGRFETATTATIVSTCACGIADIAVGGTINGTVLQNSGGNESLEGGALFVTTISITKVS